MVRVTSLTRHMPCIISIEKHPHCISAVLGQTNCALVRNTLHGLTDTMKAWLLTTPAVSTDSSWACIGEGKMFSPGNLRATFDNPEYEKLISYWVGEKYTLRYTGGMVPDVFQVKCVGSKMCL